VRGEDVVRIEKSYRHTRGGKVVPVKAHTRETVANNGRLTIKVSEEKSFLRLRLRSPRGLRQRGYTRFRTVDSGSFPGLPKDIRELVLQKPGSKVVYAFKGKEGRPQAVLIKRSP